MHGLNIRVRHLLLFALPLAALAVLVASPQLMRGTLVEGIEGISLASPTWLWLAGACFVAALACAGLGWRAGLRLCGGDTSATDACSRYGVGCLVNTALPMNLGSAIRIGLFSRVLRSDGRVWTTGGIATAIGAARGLTMAALIAIAAAGGVVPLWPVAALALLVAAAIAISYATRGSHPGTRIGHVLDAFRSLGAEPRKGLPIVGWVVLATVARLAAAASLAAAFGIHSPIGAAFLIVPALDVAGILPITPGNVGIVTAAVAFALNAHGVDGALALSAGLAFHAVETAASLLFGAGSLLYFARVPVGFRRWAVPATAGLAAIAVGGAFGATVLAPLV